MPRPASYSPFSEQLSGIYEVQEYNIDDGTGWGRTREPSALTFASHIRFSHDLAAPEILFPGLYHGLLTAMKPLMARNRVGMESSKMKEGNYEDFL